MVRQLGAGLGVGALQWAVGVFCAVIGALMLIAPHQFASSSYAVFHPNLPWWGGAFLVGGTGLLAVAALAPGRLWAIGIHVAAGVVLLSLALGFGISGAVVGVMVYGLLGSSTIVAPFLPSRAVKPDRGNLFDEVRRSIARVGELRDRLAARMEERIRAEEELQTLNAELEQRVFERTAELEGTIQALHEEMGKRHRLEEELHRRYQELQEQSELAKEESRLKSEFLANMSHELRTPLNAIIGFCELIYDEKVGPISALQQEYLGDVLTSARHLLDLISDVLDLAKIEAGKLAFRPEPTDVAQVTREVGDALGALAATKRIGSPPRSIPRSARSRYTRRASSRSSTTTCPTR